MTPCDACGRPPELGEETMSTTNPVKPFPGAAVTSSGAATEAERAAARSCCDWSGRSTYRGVCTPWPGLESPICSATAGPAWTSAPAGMRSWLTFFEALGGVRPFRVHISNGQDRHPRTGHGHRVRTGPVRIPRRTPRERHHYPKSSRIQRQVIRLERKISHEANSSHLIVAPQLVTVSNGMYRQAHHFTAGISPASAQAGRNPGSGDLSVLRGPFRSPEPGHAGTT